MDRYEKGVQLGKGTFATVYKGRDKQVSGKAFSNLSSIDSSRPHDAAAEGGTAAVHAADCGRQP